MSISLTNDVLINSVVSQREIIGETIFVESNPARIESIKINKVNSVISKVKEVSEFKLSHKGFIFKDNEEDKITEKMSSSIDDLFMDSIDTNSSEENLEYYKKGIKRIFTRTNPNLIIDSIGDYCNWIITSEKVLKELSRTNNFENINSDNPSKIELRGCIGKINIFTKETISKNHIYIGDSSETKSVFLKDITLVSNSNIYDIGVDFLFINKGIRKLILE